MSLHCNTEKQYITQTWAEEVRVLENVRPEGWVRQAKIEKKEGSIIFVLKWDFGPFLVSPTFLKSGT